MILRRSKEIFLSLFGWPTIIIVAASSLLVYFGLSLFGQKFTVIFSLVIGLLVPALIVFYGQAKFYFSCKKKKLPYRSSNLNNWLLHIIHLPFILINIGGNMIIPMFIGKDAFKVFLASYPMVTIVSSTLILLFGCTYLLLIREKFVFKISSI